jgi:hypothetical protein
LKKSVAVCLLVLFLVVGCAEGFQKEQGFNGKEKPIGSSQKDTLGDSGTLVPDWLYEAMKGKFQQPESVNKNEITLFQVRMRADNEPQIAAYLTLDRLNGTFVIFEKQENGYKEVYETREPVHAVQVYGGGNAQLVGYTSGLGGTGYQENVYHLLKFTSKGYQEVWQGTAEQYICGPLPMDKTLGSVNVDMDKSELVYGEIRRIYNDTDFIGKEPSKVETKLEVLRYNENEGKFLTNLAR